MLMLHLYEEVMVVHLFTLEGIVGGTLDGICMSCASPRNEIRNAAMFVALVIMHVSGEYKKTSTSLTLPFFKHLRQLLLGQSSGMSPTKFFCVRGTGVGRMVNDHKQEIDVRGNIVQFANQPLALWTV